MTIVKKINPQSPLGRLIQEKRDLRNQCRESETRIKESWQYIQSHAGQLLGAGVASVVIPGRKNNYANGDGAGFYEYSVGVFHLADNQTCRLSLDGRSRLAYFEKYVPEKKVM